MSRPAGWGTGYAGDLLLVISLHHPRGLYPSSELRFAGFDKESAEIACKELKRGHFECMALKD